MIRRVVASDGIGLFVEDHGPSDADAILFAHEFGGDWHTWDALVAQLAPTRRCVRYAARGFDPSETPANPRAYAQDRATADLGDVADALGLARFHLVGCSMGAFTALMAALATPHRMLSLTLIGISTGPRDVEERADYHAALTQEIALLRDQGGKGAVAWFAADPAYRRMPEKAPVVWTIYLDRLRSQSVQGAVKTLETVHWHRPSLFDLAPALAQLDVPTVLIYGDEDHPLVAPTNRFLCETLPTVTLVEAPNTGHLVHLEEHSLAMRSLGGPGRIET